MTGLRSSQIYVNIRACTYVFLPGLLKPSSILGRETGTQKHVMSDTSAATTMSSVLSEQHEVTAATHDHASFELPSFTSEQDLPPPVDSPIVTGT